jgi:hypothetical protein
MANEPKKPAEVEIPQLKKQEKERKGAGAALAGKVGGNGASVAGGAVAGAAKTGLAGLFAGKMGAAALVVGLGGAGLVGVGVMQQKNASNAPKKPQLDGLSSSIQVDKRNSQGSKSLAYMSKSSKGELRWDDPNAPKPQAKPPEKTEEELSDAAGSPSQEELMEQMGVEMPETGADKEKPTMGRIDASLSKELGGSNAFGSKSIFSGGTGFDIARMKNMNKNKIKEPPNRAMSEARGKSSGLRRGRSARGKSLSTRGIRANRAMGQLKFAGRQSNAAANAGSAGAAAAAAGGAFEGAKTEGGELGGPAGAIGEDMPTVQPPGSGAPSGGGGGANACPSNWTQVEGGGCEPPDLEGTNVTPYQGLVDNAKGMSEQAEKLKTMAIALMILGAALLAAWPWGTLIGVILLALGAMMYSMAKSMSSQAENMGRQISNQYGQEEQGKIIERHGSNSANPNESRDRDIEVKNTAKDDIEAERNADYTLEE